MIIIILIVFIILCIWWFKKNPIYKKHDYWDIQPVSRNQSKVGYISNNLLAPIQPSTVDALLSIKIFNPHNQNELTTVTEFINANYIYKYHYTCEFIKWSVMSPNSKPKYNLLLYYENTLVGTIFSRTIDIILYGKQLPLFYVDFLCIHKEHRKKNWAPILISNIVDTCADAVYYAFIFKIEKYPLPFNYVSVKHYYYLDITSYKSKYHNKLDWKNYHIQKTSLSSLTEVYRFFNKHTKKYTLYPFFSKIEFMYYFVPSSKIGCCYELRNKDNVLVAMLFYSINYYKEKNIVPIADLQYIFSDDTDIILPFLDEILNRLSRTHFTYISTTSIMNNKYIIDAFRFKKSMKFYYQMYNYHLKDVLCENEIAFNIP